VAVLHQLRREAKLAQARVEAALAVAQEHGLPLFAALAMTLRGWALAEQGRADEGIAQMQQGLAAQQMTGRLLVRPHLLAFLAEALSHAGQAEAGLRALDEALALAEQTDERDYEAELYRLQGELLLRQVRAESNTGIATAGSSTLAQRNPPSLPKRKPVFLRPLRLRAGNRQDTGSCGRL
jgi:predicted ATPase